MGNEYPISNFQCPNARLNLEIGNWKLAIGNSLLGRGRGKKVDGLRLSVDGRKNTNLGSIY
jgi:hypothetical protein